MSFPGIIQPGASLEKDTAAMPKELNQAKSSSADPGASERCFRK